MIEFANIGLTGIGDQIDGNPRTSFQVKQKAAGFLPGIGKILSIGEISIQIATGEQVSDICKPHRNPVLGDVHIIFPFDLQEDLGCWMPFIVAADSQFFPHLQTRMLFVIILEIQAVKINGTDLIDIGCL